MSIGSVSGGSSMISSLLLKALDQDKSGAASLEEFTSVGQSLSGASFDQSEEGLASAFSSLDADQDGSLTEAEVAQGLARFSQDSAGALLGAQEAGGPPPPPPGGPGGPGGGGGFFAEADADGSGSVSLAEFTSAGPKSVSTEDAEGLFSQIDADGDGEISSDEDEAFRATQGPHGPDGAPPPPPSGGASASSDDEDTGSTDAFLAQLSDLLDARGAYGRSDVSRFEQAISSLFTASA